MKNVKEFVEFLEELMNAAPEVVEGANKKALAAVEELRRAATPGIEPLTANGKVILKFLQEQSDTSKWKAKEIAEELFVSSRTVASAIRKLVIDGYVKVIEKDPNVYMITTEGKNTVIENEEEGE